MPVLLLRPQVLSTLACPAGQRKQDYRDSHCKGLLLEVRSTGGRTWYLRYVTSRGQRRQLRLGDLHDLSLAQARRLADQHRSEVAMGNDPSQNRRELRAVPTLEAFCEQQLIPFLKVSKRSWRWDVSLLRCHLIPALGSKTLDAVSRVDVLALQASKLESGLAVGTVYRVMALLRHCYKLALDWEVSGVSSNPCLKVPLPRVEQVRERFLTAEEAQRLLVAVRSSKNRELEGIVCFLLLTGARKREVLDARWEHVDWQQRLWLIPFSKNGHRRYVPLNESALVLLRRRELEVGSTGWLFANPETGKPYANLHYSWDWSRKRAGLEGLRIHDLRHSFASFAINAGRSLYEVQMLLGHRSSAMTQRYAHLATDTLLAATNAAVVALDGVVPQ